MLSKAQLQSYKENGFIVLDDVYTTVELEECLSEYDKVFQLKENSDLEATWKGDWKKSDNLGVHLVVYHDEFI